MTSTLPPTVCGYGHRLSSKEATSCHRRCLKQPFCLLAILALAVSQLVAGPLGVWRHTPRVFFYSPAPTKTGSLAGGPTSTASTQTIAASDQDSNTVPEVKTVDEYHQMLEHSDGLVVAVFTSPYCGPCLLAEPQVEAMAAEMAPRLRVFKLKLAGPTVKAFKEISSELEVRVLPTFVVYNSGEVIGRVTGAKVGDLRDLVLQHL